MLSKILLANEKYKLFDNVKHITVALSGGADSVALLHALCSLKDTFGFSVSAAHLNHSIRGEEAIRDAAFSKSFAESLKVPFFEKTVNIPEISKKTGDSIELAARKERYAFLSSVSRDKIATAHTLSDSVETVIYNMSRGSSLDGICGIPAKRENIIRPLIFATRKDIESYCLQNNLSFVTDSTNLSDAYSRNKIRHLVVPVLNEINLGAEKNISYLTESLKDDADFLDTAAENLFEKAFQNHKLDLFVLKDQHNAILSRVIAKFIKLETAVSPDRKHILSILEMLKNNTKRVSLNGNFSAVLSFSYLKIEKESKPTAFFFEVLKDFSNQSSFSLSKENLSDIENVENINNLLLYNAVDYDKIQGRLAFRSRQSGDKICLAKRNVTKTLKKLFIEDKIDESLRDKINILFDEKGIVWVEGYGADKRAAVTDKTKNVLIINSKKA